MEEEWTEVARAADVPADGTLRVAYANEPVCLYNLEGTIYATHDTCTHAEASLAEGFIIGENIECPLHQGLFHIPTGKAVAHPCYRDVRTYAVKVEAGAVKLRPNTASDETAKEQA
jgi:nitrite reductase/ring-hydroxylating ferredoxin subunit